MKKQILSIILACVLFFTMTACTKIKEPIPSTEPPVEIQLEEQIDVQTEASTEATETLDPYRIPDCLEFVDFETVDAMTLEEVNALSENLVNMSQTAYNRNWFNH